MPRKSAARRRPSIQRADAPKKGGTLAIQLARKAASQETFLAQFRASGTVTSACMATGIDRNTHYGWLASDPAYVKAFQAVEVEAIDVLESEARRRALIGNDKPVFYKGRQVATVKEYSDGLLMFLLNGRRPDVFKYRHEHTGKNGGPIQTEMTVVHLHELSDDELAITVKLLARVEAGKAQALPAQVVANA